ncbi:MAG: signal peptidase I, partial [Cellvibrio sp.]
NKSIFIFLSLMLIFRSACADWNTVPTASMKPTILEGDRIGINKLAYDLHLPFTHISLLKIADPQRGDIAVFDSKVSNKRLVKRVIGLPGDTIAMVNNQLIINGSAIQYIDSTSESDKLEQLFEKTHTIRIGDSADHAFANFHAVTVPANQYLVLGDNRDLSADSRVIGFVPREEFVGRSSSVIASFNYDNFYLPRADRFFKSL